MSPTSVLESAWGLYRAHWQHFVTLALVVFAVVAVISALLAPLGAVGALIGTVVSLIGTFLVWGALVTAVDDVRDGRVDLSVSDTFRASKDRLGQVAIAGIIVGLIVGIGLILLVVPGLFALTWLFAVIPVVVLEKLDFGQAWNRSIELVKGNAWQVFVLILLTFLVLFVASLIIGLVLSIFGLPGWLNTLLRTVIANAIFVPFVACAFTLGYFALKEGESPSSMA